MDSQTTDNQPDDSDGPSRGLLIAALVLAVGAIGVVLAIAATRQAPEQPVAIPSVSAPQAQTAACRVLLDALPHGLGNYQWAPAAPVGVAAWRAAGDSEPVVLRCGVERPAGFVVGAPIVAVNQVQWYEDSHPASGGSIWYAVDRPVYLQLTLPAGSGPTPIQQLSDVIDHTMAAVPVRPAPVG